MDWTAWTEAGSFASRRWAIGDDLTALVGDRGVVKPGWICWRLIPARAGAKPLRALTWPRLVRRLLAEELTCLPR